MKIGIAYDTEEMYFQPETNMLYHDFADGASISILKKTIESLGYEVEMLGNIQSIAKQLKTGEFNCDLVYNTVEGIYSRNREGLLPALLEIYRIPYMGTDSFGLSLSLDKEKTKKLAESLGIKTPAYCAFQFNDDASTVKKELQKLRLPIITKPNYEGNSSGITVSETYADAEKSVQQLLMQYKTTVLCEEFVLGREITVPLIGNSQDISLFGVTSINIQNDDRFWLDYKMKLFGNYHNIVLSLPDEISSRFYTSSILLFNAIGCCDFARFDYRLANDNSIFFIEANPLPSLFKGGSFDVVGEANGFSFNNTIGLIISVACQRLAIPRT